MELNKTKYNVRMDGYVRKIFNKLDNSVKSAIIKFFRKEALLSQPRSFGKPLQYELYGLWRYRVGDWRIIAKIQDNVLTILVIDIDKRDEVYK